MSHAGNGLAGPTSVSTSPRYRPWQQRIVIAPDGDLFEALREGKASIVTDTIETFTEHRIRVSTGEEIPADIVVTATGFNLSVLGDVAFTVDGELVDFTEHVTWRGIMINGLPNMAYVFGYFRHSWTLRVDLVNDLVGRLLVKMRDKGATMVVPALRPRTRICSCGRGPIWRTSTPAMSCARSTFCLTGRSRAVDPPAGARAGARDPAGGEPRRPDARLLLSAVRRVLGGRADRRGAARMSAATTPGSAQA